MRRRLSAGVGRNDAARASAAHAAARLGALIVSDGLRHASLGLTAPLAGDLEFTKLKAHYGNSRRLEFCITPAHSMRRPPEPVPAPRLDPGPPPTTPSSPPQTPAPAHTPSPLHLIQLFAV